MGYDVADEGRVVSGLLRVTGKGRGQGCSGSFRDFGRGWTDCPGWVMIGLIKGWQNGLVTTMSGVNLVASYWG